MEANYGSAAVAWETSLWLQRQRAIAAMFFTIVVPPLLVLTLRMVSVGIILFRILGDLSMLRMQ